MKAADNIGYNIMVLMQHFCGGYFKGNAGDFRHVRNIKKLVRPKRGQRTFFFLSFFKPETGLNYI